MAAWGYEFYLRVLKVSLFNWADMSCSIRVRIVYESSKLFPKYMKKVTKFGLQVLTRKASSF